MTLDFISLTLHMAFMGWLDTRGRGRGGCGGVYGHVALLGYDCEKGAGIKPFTRATLWILSLTTLGVQRGGGQKVCPFVHFQNNLEHNI